MMTIRRLSKKGDGICVCGDFNCSFFDNYYFTRAGRNDLQNLFQEVELSLLTGEQAECIDHIAISRRFASFVKLTIEEWNEDKLLSDHKGIAVSF